ncbi:MAG: hypothetical protein K940chlam7_01164 [Chlamydiae bacterium]|nr:hypothetical protein [Chlamydiota bacterium]
MKFLCDQMLVRLGRWLRAAGYDTAIIETSISDREVLDIALKEGRYLITRDAHFLGFQEAKDLLIWLEANTVEGCARELSQKISINWTKDPFSRCLLCNEELCEAGREIAEEVPEDVRARCDKYWLCKKCGKVYWLGSHTKRMLTKLKKWQK